MGSSQTVEKNAPTPPTPATDASPEPSEQVPSTKTIQNPPKASETNNCAPKNETTPSEQTSSTKRSRFSIQRFSKSKEPKSPSPEDPQLQETAANKEDKVVLQLAELDKEKPGRKKIKFFAFFFILNTVDLGTDIATAIEWLSSGEDVVIMAIIILLGGVYGYGCYIFDAW
eukprot:CAMPEP_0201585674 /NCGR_PEP_ID=MMETSP0190_2-20130828/124481_1 /ASSEMBLY_ACC=CAM_ASM_000263 /TAXON_ID=37353 /ORGANISM="Rosalina sp." /LENGTH=170 /DNA_ID=CAMNT_0048032095 /DNA_START=34 /DNA_END=543 /DNA_ORIENTATION=+